MASEGPNSPGTMVDDNAIGNRTWTSTENNAKVSNNTYATSESFETDVCHDEEIKIIKGGSVGSTNKSEGDVWGVSDPNSYKSYGGAEDLWGETWTAEDINSSNFGVVVAAESKYNTYITHYLKATNFGFSIPGGSTIDGIVVEVERFWASGGKAPGTARVDHIRITVYYSEAAAPTGTNAYINIGDTFKEISKMYINIGDAWKEIGKSYINIGDSWKEMF